MNEPRAAVSAARPPAAGNAPAVITLLAPGAAVGHANPELAGWEGVIEAAARQPWHRRDEIRVRWTAGPSGPLVGAEPGWHSAAAITVKGRCPDCGRPARYVQAGNQYGQAAGWHHDARADAATCPAGGAAGIIEGTVVPEDIIRANMRAAGFPVGSAAEARAVRDEAGQWARDFAAACRAEDPIVISRPAGPR